MEADLVRDGGLVAAALLGSNVNEDGAIEVAQRTPQNALEAAQAVARDRPDIRDSEVLEQLARLREVDDRLAQSLRPLKRCRADDGLTLDEIVVDPLRATPRPRKLDPAQVLAEGANGGRNAHLVVVKHDQHARLAVADVVQRLEGHPAHERRVAHNDYDALAGAALVPRQGQSFGDGKAGAGVAAVENVVLALRSTREAADAAQLAERPEV